MADLRCPMCSKSNPEELEICQYCQARLKPLVASPPSNAEAIRPGDEPTKKSTAEFEKVTYPAPPDAKTPIHPGQEPTKKKTAELERALPTWLRTLREQKEENPPDQTAEATSGTGPAIEQEKASSSESSEEKVSDWLAGLDALSIEERESPESLEKTSDESRPEAEEPPVETSEPEAHSEATEPDWLKDLRGANTAGPAEAYTESDAEPVEELPDWLERLRVETPPIAEESSLKTGGAEPETRAENAVPDWLANIKSDAARAEFSQSTTPEEPIPDWLEEISTQTTSIQSEVIKADQAEEEPVVSGTEEPEPEWQGEAAQIAPEPTSPPTFISEEGEIAGEVDKILSMETPEWLSALKPEEKDEGTPPFESKKAEEIPGELEPADLPSWVQAMRPVEAVVAETTPTDELDEEEEGKGPLAGIRGVLPVGPGPGKIRKPPAYSVKLQVTESQQSYATILESLITSEIATQSGTSQKEALATRILRWGITAVLLIAVSLPIIVNSSFIPPPLGYPPEMLAARGVVSALSVNDPVLVAFDYEPALSSELEAAASPLLNEILLRGARLTVISTSPTGPILAERFFQTIQDEYNPQSGQHYVNLGYLAGGPTGILDFAANPQHTAPNTFDGQPAWQLPPLLSVQNLDDFSAVIVITENTDIGRIWIEQVGTFLNGQPIIMVTSAQAEPMIQPYYDSQQIKGLISGLAGGMTYESASRNPGLASTYWDSFSIGLFIAIIMIVSGSIWSSISSRRSRRAKSKTEG